jgi:DNA-binding NarL/FixJ family response regulator
MIKQNIITIQVSPEELQNAKDTLQKVKHKTAIRLPMGEGADKRYLENLRKNKKEKVVNHNKTRNKGSISETYLKVVDYHKEGLDTIQIAKKLYITKQAVSYHLKNYENKTKCK